MVWEPGDPWPSFSTGGAARDEWSGYIRVWLHAEIAAGTPFRMGTDAADRLDAGNVMFQAGTERATGDPTALWVDLTADLVDVQISLGGSSGSGILSKSEAGTLTATLYDPDGRYDPLNPSGPYALHGRTRLTPGIRICCWCEVVANPASMTVPNVIRYALFSGTADRWSQDWKREPTERFAKLVATDPTKQFARFDKPGLSSPIGQGDSPLVRLQRIVSNYGWTGTVQGVGATTVTLQSTTLAQSGWELVNRTAADELGFAYFLPQRFVVADSGPGVLALVAREIWTQRPAPSIEIGCGPGLHDIAVEVVPAAFDAQLRNAAYVSRSGGTQQIVKSQSSIEAFWEQSIERTDLGLADDTQVAKWGEAIVNLSAYPQTAIEKLTLRPDVDPVPWDTWELVLNQGLINGLIRVVREQAGYTVDTEARLVGWSHRITLDDWSVEWRTVASSVSSSGATFHLGPHNQDQLDAGYVFA